MAAIAPLMTVPEVAERLRKTQQFVRDELRRGRLRGSFYGGAWHVREDDLEIYFDSHANMRWVRQRP